MTRGTPGLEGREEWAGSVGHPFSSSSQVISFRRVDKRQEEEGVNEESDEWEMVNRELRNLEV